MQIAISDTDQLSLIESALASDRLGHAADLLDTYLKEIRHEEVDADRLLNLRLKILINQGRFAELESLVKESSTGVPKTKARLNVAQGILANRSGDYRASLTWFLEAESLSNNIDDLPLQAQIQINIGTVYASLHHYTEGLGRYQGVLDNYDEAISSRTKAALLNNLGNLYYANDNIERSISSLSSSISISSEIGDDQLLRLSRILLARSKFKNEEPIDLEGIEIEQEADIYPLYQYCKYKSSSDSTEEDLSAIISMSSDRKDFMTQIEALNTLIDLQKGQDDYKNAFETMERLRSVENELKQIQEDARLIEQTVKFEIAEKEQAIKAFEKEQSLQKEIVKRNDMLEVANEDLRQFAYVVSHDLKEPLRMIGAYTQLIEMETKGSVKGDAVEYFDFVKGGVGRLNVLLDGLSNYSTLKTLQESKENLPISALVGAAVDNLDFLIKETSATVEIIQDLEIKGSKALLVLLFQNLIQNAIKFRKEDNTPIIKIDSGSTNDGQFIEVSDNGIGIPADQSDRIFIIFQRLSRSENNGSGMGLAICKKIVQLHEGKVFVKQSSDEGTTFRIELPH